MSVLRPSPTYLVQKDDALSACEAVLTELLVDYLTGHPETWERVKAARDKALAARLVDKEGG